MANLSRSRLRRKHKVSDSGRVSGTRSVKTAGRVGR
jgi:hypothetical protein